ncbi:MAG: nitrous oxide reductase accessory protein NosL [Sulfurimonas sp.]
MKKVLLVLVAVVGMVSFSQAEMKCGAGKCGGKAPAQQPKKMMKMFQSVDASEATLLQKGDAKAFCPNCGMTLPMYYKTNHVATVNGKVKQYCSMHCLAEDMEKGLNPTDIKVVDVSSLKFIDAKKAHYVVGSKKKGTMTMVSKYAFANEADAKAFAKANGGKRMTFGAALQKAKKGFKKESSMIGKKQDKMRAMGKKLYAGKCQKTDKKFASTAEAKAFVISNKLCEGLNPKQLHAVGLYLGNR